MTEEQIKTTLSQLREFGGPTAIAAIQVIESLEADCAAMRGALEYIAQFQDDKCQTTFAETLDALLDLKVSAARAALSTDVGKELLERVERLEKALPKHDYVFEWSEETGAKICFLRVASTGRTPKQEIQAALQSITRDGVGVESTQEPSRFSLNDKGSG